MEARPQIDWLSTVRTGPYPSPIQHPRAGSTAVANAALISCRDALAVWLSTTIGWSKCLLYVAEPHPTMGHVPLVKAAQYERPWLAHDGDTVLRNAARLRRVDTSTANGRSGRVGNLDDPQLKRRRLDDLPFPLLHKTMLGPRIDLRIGPHVLGFFLFGEEYILTDRTLLFVGQIRPMSASLPAPTAPRRRAAALPSTSYYLTGHAATDDHPPRFIIGIALRARDIGQAVVAGMTGQATRVPGAG